MVEIILLAMVAVFVGLRLFSVLGQRTGHEQEHAPRPVERPAQVAPVPDPVPDSPPARQAQEESIVSPLADGGIRQIAAADSGFDVNEFVIGAQSAYRMILEAFWKGDKETLGDLVDYDVLGAFGQAIDERNEEGHVLENRLIAIERTLIESAELNGAMARITVRFDADIAAVTRDKDGEVIAGSMSDAVPTHDVWSFARNVRESDPNWLLVETAEAA